jgi:hypothetical protein
VKCARLRGFMIHPVRSRLRSQGAGNHTVRQSGRRAGVVRDIPIEGRDSTDRHLAPIGDAKLMNGRFLKSPGTQPGDRHWKTVAANVVLHRLLAADQK